MTGPAGYATVKVLNSKDSFPHATFDIILHGWHNFLRKNLQTPLYVATVAVMTSCFHRRFELACKELGNACSQEFVFW